MVQPINYGAVFQGQESPADAFEQAFKSATGIRQIMDAREAAQRQAEAQAAMQQELASVANNPNATAADYSRLMTKYPALSENLKRSWDTLSAGQQKSGLATLSKASAAFTAGKPDVVIGLLKSESEALRNAGDTANAELYDRLARATEISPDYGKRLAFTMLAGVPGGDKVIEGLGKFGAEERAQELQPIAVRRQTAEAEGAEAEATTEGVTARFAESNALKDLEQKGWNIKALQADIDFKRQQSRIAAMNAAIAREGNDLKRQELRMKLDDAVRERESKLREKVATAESGAANIDNMLNTIERIKANPALNDVVGSLEGRMPEFTSAFDDKESDAIALIETLGSQAFLSQIASIKGMGALSNEEGKKLQAALQNLGRAQSEKQFRANLDEAARLLNSGRESIFKSAGLPPTRPDTPAAPGARPTLESFEGMR